MYTYTSSTRTRRGGSCLKEIYIYIYKTFLIYRTCMRRVPAKPVRACTLRKLCRVSHVTFEAPLRTSHFSLHSSHSTLHTSHSTLHTSVGCFVRSCCADVVQEHDPRTTPAQCNAKQTLSSHFTLHSSHFTLALHTCTSHFALDTSSLKSCELFSPDLRSSHLIPSLLTCQLSKFFSTVFTSSEHWSTFLISLEFVSTHLSCSARKKALTVREKSFAQKNIGRRKLLHTDTWDTDAFTYNSLSEILWTTKLAQSTSQYYFVLQSLHKALPSTTLYYKACTKHFPVLLCTTKACTNYFPVLLCTTKQAKSTS